MASKFLTGAVNISDQSAELPILSFGPSNENYTSATTEFTATLRNKCALVKFDLGEMNTDAAITLTGMKTEATIGFDGTVTNGTTTGDIVTYGTGTTRYAMVLTDQAAVTEGTIAADIYEGTFTMPAASLNASVDNATMTIFPKGAINGKFSVSANKKVYFAKGNLQYTKSTETWSFMEHQYDVVEATDQEVGIDYLNQNIVSLFGWSTSGYHDGADTYNTNYHPYSTSTNQVNTDFNTYGYGPSTTMTDLNLVGTSANYDWGVNNIIHADGTEIAAGTYRSLTMDEWVYLFNTRKVTVGSVQKVPYGHGRVNGKNGVILLPDNWDGSVCSSFTYGPSEWSNQFSENTTTKWSEMEAAGCVFLPAASYRYRSMAQGVGYSCVYWSSTAYMSTNTKAWCVRVESNSAYVESSSDRCAGLSVRLVFPAENKPVLPNL